MKVFDSRPERARIVRIPADTRIERTYDEIPLNLDAIKDAIGGGWIEIVRPRHIPEVDGVRIVMVVDDEGLLKGLPFNNRASLLYPGPTGITGDVIIMGEALVADEDGFAEPDLVGVPETYEFRG